MFFVFRNFPLNDIHPHAQHASELLELDVNVRVCFMSAAEVNIEVLREVYPKARSTGCFIKKPVSIEYLAKKLEGELY